MKKKMILAMGSLLVASVLSVSTFIPSAKAITPDEYVQLGFGFFPHYGLNTYTGTAGGDGDLQCRQSHFRCMQGVRIEVCHLF